ncbi:uracil-DNA glycosylase [Paenibacillus thailandensis]|uniref:Uracil-DNA glycosylase n=1 Tax=Paenibacillus thailandensis TaxID=393250 RepID=A0ABW5QXL3_9BACL
MQQTLLNDWTEILQSEMEQSYYKEMLEYLDGRYKAGTVYPERERIFSALQYTPYERTRVVLLGQDPYHGPGQAHGLSFSVRPGVKLPPSLRNIYKELNEDLGCPIPDHGYLADWAKQGVLLLNTVLTVEDGQAGSHQRIGWERFTDRIIAALNDREEPVVFILWGKHAQDKASRINRERHYIIESAHPSPLSAHRGFFGSRPFSRTNAILRRIGKPEIDWTIRPLAALTKD